MQAPQGELRDCRGTGEIAGPLPAIIWRRFGKAIRTALKLAFRHR
jgi:hypothetical protein